MEATTAIEPLTAKEQKHLGACEAIIESGISGWLTVGQALAEIKDGRLYRLEHDTFADYCRARWDMGKSRAYQLIGASETVSTMVDKPKNERQARALQHVKPSGREKVMKRAAASGVVTSASIKKAAEAPTPKARKDEAGNVIPSHLIDAFAEADQFSDIAQTIQAGKMAAARLASSSLGAFLNRQQIDSDLHNAYRAVKWAAPYAVCPYCEGKKGGCQACRKQGWVPKEVYEARPKEGKGR